MKYYVKNDMVIQILRKREMMVYIDGEPLVKKLNKDIIDDSVFDSRLTIFEGQNLAKDMFYKSSKQTESVYLNYQDLVRRDLTIVSIRVVSDKERFFEGQSAIYDITDMKYGLTKGAIPLNYCPQGHKIQMDVITQQVRLLGRNAGVEGYSEWRNLKYD